MTCTALDQCHVAGTCTGGRDLLEPATRPTGRPATTATPAPPPTPATAGPARERPVTCTALDQCHVAGTCQADGTCSNPNKTDGTTCNDGNACTTADACQGGTCTGATVTCSGADQCHSVGSVRSRNGLPGSGRGGERDDLRRRQRLHHRRQLPGGELRVGRVDLRRHSASCRRRLPASGLDIRGQRQLLVQPRRTPSPAIR